MPGAQLLQHRGRHAVVRAEQAFGLLLQRTFQCIDPLFAGFNASPNQFLVHLHPTVGKSAQVAAQPVLVDGIVGTAAHIGNAAHAQLQQQAGHLGGRSYLVVIHLGHLIVIHAANGHKRHVVALQSLHTFIVQHRTGQNHAIHLVGFQLAFQLANIGFSRIAQQQVIPALGRHVPHTAHALAQERQVQPHKMLGDHQRKVIGWALLRSAQRRSCILAALADIIEHTRAGSLAHAAFAGYCAGYRCF